MAYYKIISCLSMQNEGISKTNTEDPKTPSENVQVDHESDHLSETES